MISLKQQIKAGSAMEAQSIVGDHISVLVATAVRPDGKPAWVGFRVGIWDLWETSEVVDADCSLGKRESIEKNVSSKPAPRVSIHNSLRSQRFTNVM